MRIIVQKYGGTSVKNAARIRRVAKRIVGLKRDDTGVVVVVSAMGDTTDKLLALARKINAKPDDREYDMLLSTGEQVSVALLTMAIHRLGYDAISLTGIQAGIKTDGVHSKASITSVDTRALERHISEGRICIVAGFQGVDPHEDITTLGRGGSDTTAVALAAALNAEICEILTDVEGVYTTDPRIVPGARKHREISYREMLELASLGAKVLHPRSVELARDYRVHLSVRSSLNNKPGTIVKGVEELEKLQPVSGIALDDNTAKISILGVPDRPGVAAEIFSKLGGGHINVDMIIQNVTHNGLNDITFTVARDELDKAVELVNSLPGDLRAGVSTDPDICKLSIVGAGMVSRPGVAARMFKALGDAGVNIGMISTSEIKISCLINRADGKKAVSVLHDAFNLEAE